MSTFFTVSQDWYGAGSWNCSSWKIRTWLYCMVKYECWWPGDTWRHKEPGPWFNIKMSSYQYRKPHCGDKTILRPSYLHNGVSYTGKMASLYWIRAQGIIVLTQFVWYIPVSTPRPSSHWGRDKMAIISQTIFSNAFPWMKMYQFWLQFHWSLFLRVQLTIFHHWFR